jgi:hypothetical protein
MIYNLKIKIIVSIYEKIQTERQQYKEVKVILTESRERWRTQ